MYDTGIVELRKITENQWKAKYQGNYGVYTIKITTNGKKTVKYSCSCPSDYSPCKHISMIEEAIAKKIAADEKEEKSNGLRMEDFIGNVSPERLREFIITQAKYNTELSNAILIEFSTNARNVKGNKYSRLIQATLASVPHDENDYYLEECLNIDALDQWIDKAGNCMRLKQYDEAVLICKAVIEEYSQWLYNIGENVSMNFSLEYESVPFDIINDFINAKEKDPEKYFNDTWLELLLDIAQKEKDIPSVRKLSYRFIEEYFDEEHYKIYKAAFSPAKWADEREKLFLSYSGKKGFSNSAASLLVAENEIERLLNYVEKHLSLDRLERYYEAFSSDYPEKTLEMFKKVLVSYADNNTGRSFYEHILSLLKAISRIKGGKKAASDLIKDFKIHYKNRKAMMEVLSGF